jgi:hypothetical protein
MAVMTDAQYDVWYDPNEVDANGQVQVLRAWVRQDVTIALGGEILAGDDELAPVHARVVAFDTNTGIITLRLNIGADAGSSAVA